MTDGVGLPNFGRPGKSATRRVTLIRWRVTIGRKDDASSIVVVDAVDKAGAGRAAYASIERAHGDAQEIVSVDLIKRLP